MTAQEDAPEEYEGPDFNSWPQEATDMWKLVLDIEACDRILAAMNGPIAQDAGPYYQEGRRFLQRAGQQLRAQLGTMICSTYGIELTEDDGQEPFRGAGRARAFRGERPPDATT